MRRFLATSAVIVSVVLAINLALFRSHGINMVWFHNNVGSTCMFPQLVSRSSPSRPFRSVSRYYPW